MKVVEEIGKQKKASNLTILQTKRWDDIVKKRVDLGARKGLSEEFILKVFQAIHQESINHQTVIMNQPELLKNEKDRA
jgi:chorismate mutase